jgi:hypothetical protein
MLASFLGVLPILTPPLGTDLTKDIQNLYAENYKTLEKF